MPKILCERPRTNSGHGDEDRIESRHKRNNLQLVQGEDEDGKYIESNAPKNFSMGRGWRGGGTKELNENLKPLFRWLDKQVNRNWDKVYSELRKRIDVRDAVQLHIMQHLWWHVEKHVMIENGKVYENNSSRGFSFELSNDQLYIHPEDNILKKYKKDKGKSRAEKRKEQRDSIIIDIDDKHYIIKVKGIWYQFKFETSPKEAYLWHLATDERDQWGWPLGKEISDLQPEKKQLSAKQLRKLSLKND